MDSLMIRLEDEGSKGRYVVTVDGHDAEMTFSRLNDHHIIVDHTGVPEALGGRGIGQALAENVVAEARKKGFKITPLCPFLAAQYRRNPDWSDTLAP
jgi:predicted GNAT family acetyltransferase